MAIFGNPVGQAVNGHTIALHVNGNGHTIPTPGEPTRLTETLAEEVQTGLTKLPKSLSSRFFYDDEGSRLFQAIMHLPEYYLTRAEFEILDTYKQALLDLFAANDRPFELVELGAGDGLKTKILIDYFWNQGAPFSYAPVDISKGALDSLIADIRTQWPHLQIDPREGEYLKALNRLAETPRRPIAGHANPRRVVLFLGSNIGNFAPVDALAFYQKISEQLQPGDLLLTGFDLQKHPAIIHAAYNDSQGLTRAFNLNLLRRINRELDANFDLLAFDHYETYQPETGEARSYLVSRDEQLVTVAALDLIVPFERGEVIYTEMSRKFTRTGIEELANQTNFYVSGWFTDCKDYFADVVYEKR
ncbi:MAG: L-histidine N(alpha)-methyltransferase [Rudanella sp.]|nr:L-histidine N(alpha)-methyltransferase [Rudanella sp.]